MQASEIRELTESDIRSRIDELERERFNLKFRGATQTLEDPLRLRVLRKDVARLKTVLRERELGVARAPGAAEAGPRGEAAPAPAKRAARKGAAKKPAAKKAAGKKAAAKKGAKGAPKSASKSRTTASTKARTAAPKARTQER